MFFRKRLRSALLCICTLTAWIGCGDPAVAPGDATLALGTGEWQFEAFEDGDQLPLIAGSQGGHHVWLSFLADDLSPGDAKLTIETQLADDSLEAQRSRVQVTLKRAGEHEAAYLGWPAIIAQPGCIAGQMLRVRVELEDQRSRKAVSERYLIPMGESLPTCPTTTP